MHSTDYCKFLMKAAKETLNEIFSINNECDFEIRPEYLVTVLLGSNMNKYLKKSLYFEEQVIDLAKFNFRFNLMRDFAKRASLLKLRSSLAKLFSRKNGNVDIAFYDKGLGGEFLGENSKGSVYSIIEVKKNGNNKKEIDKDIIRLIDFMIYSLNDESKHLSYASLVFFPDEKDIRDYRSLCNKLLSAHNKNICVKVDDGVESFKDAEHEDYDGSEARVFIKKIIVITFYKCDV